MITLMLRSAMNLHAFRLYRQCRSPSRYAEDTQSISGNYARRSSTLQSGINWDKINYAFIMLTVTAILKCRLVVFHQWCHRFIGIYFRERATHAKVRRRSSQLIISELIDKCRLKSSVTSQEMKQMPTTLVLVELESMVQPVNGKQKREGEDTCGSEP